jgi:hypothetical protein
MEQVYEEEEESEKKSKNKNAKHGNSTGENYACKMNRRR